MKQWNFRSTSTIFLALYILALIPTIPCQNRTSLQKRSWRDTLCKSFSISAIRHHTYAISINISFDATCDTVPRSAYPVRFFFNLNLNGAASTPDQNLDSALYMACSCREIRCAKDYGNLKMLEKDYLLSVVPRCSAYGPGVNACSVCPSIQLILPYTKNPSAAIYEGGHVKNTHNASGQDGGVVTWLIVVAVAGPAVLALILVALLIRLCRTPRDPPRRQSTTLQNSQYLEEIPLQSKRVLVIAHSSKHFVKNEIFLRVLRKFDDLNIIYIEDCLREHHSNHHNWIQNEVLRCDVVILILSRELNEIVSCDNEHLHDCFSYDHLAPVIYELVNFCQAVNVPKYVATFETDLEYCRTFFEKYQSFDTGIIFNLSNLKDDVDVTFSYTVPDLFHLLSAIYSDVIPERLEPNGFISHTLEADSVIDMDIPPAGTQV